MNSAKPNDAGVSRPDPLPDVAVREEDITGQPQGAPLTAEPGQEVVQGDPSMKGGGPGGEKELKGPDALGGSDADLGRGGD
jgi:hypothetical protein